VQASPRPTDAGIRRGVSLIAIVVTVMIIAVLAAVAVPYLRESNDEMSAPRTAQILRTLELDLNNSVAGNGLDGFCKRVGVCPQQLQQLTRQITVADKRACGGAVYTGGQAGNWIANAPYSGIPIVPGYGVWTPLGVIHDSVIRISQGDIEMHIDSMARNAVIDLDVAVDAVSDSANGQLKYVNTAVNTSGQILRLAKYSIVVTNPQCP
jgi:type II secretory pathway pseudopilin PulG